MYTPPSSYSSPSEAEILRGLPPSERVCRSFFRFALPRGRAMNSLNTVSDDPSTDLATSSVCLTRRFFNVLCRKSPLDLDGATLYVTMWLVRSTRVVPLGPIGPATFQESILSFAKLHAPALRHRIDKSFLSGIQEQARAFLLRNPYLHAASRDTDAPFRVRVHWGPLLPPMDSLGIGSHAQTEFAQAR